MKKHFINTVLLIVIVAISVSCSPKQEKDVLLPGDVVVHAEEFDAMSSFGYQLSDEIREVSNISALRRGYDDSVTPRSTKTVEFRQATLSVTYMRSVKPNMRTLGYDIYYFSDSGKIISIYFAHNSDSVIGFSEDIPFDTAPKKLTVTEEELVEIARNAIGEYIDGDYYSHYDIYYDDKTCSVEFYNLLGDIRVVDASVVQMLLDGTVVKVLALPEPNILNSCGASVPDSKAFDTAAESAITDIYTDYHRDDSEMYVDIKYAGYTVQTRMLSVDDDGRPVVLYLCYPKMQTEAFLKGSAEQEIQKIWEPPVYVAVYAE